MQREWDQKATGQVPSLVPPLFVSSLFLQHGQLTAERFPIQETFRLIVLNTTCYKHRIHKPL